MIDIRLKVFCSVAANLSFTKASQELFISQPAVSKHIQELEREYDTRLFDRMGSRIQLTKSGQLLLEHANRILKDYQQLDYDMGALHKNARGELHIGASTTISQYVVPELIADFHRHNPDVQITLLSGNSREVEAALARGTINVGMVEGVIRQPQFKYTPFMDDEIVAIVSTHGALSKLESITLEQLKHIPIVFREFGSGTLDVIQQALARHEIALSDLDIVMNFGTTEGIKHYVKHSDAMGIVGIRSVTLDVANGVFRIVDIEKLNLSRQFAFVEQRGASTGLTRQFVSFITKGYKA